MKEAYDNAYKHKMMSLQQIISELKSHGVKYNCDWRVNNVKGCFYNVKFRKHDDDDDESYDHGVNKEKQSINYILQSDYEKLKKDYEKLKEQLSKQNEVVVKEKPKVDYFDEIVKETKLMFGRIHNMNKTANAIFDVMDNPPHDVTDVFFNKLF